MSGDTPPLSAKLVEILRCCMTARHDRGKHAVQRFAEFAGAVQSPWSLTSAACQLPEDARGERARLAQKREQVGVAGQQFLFALGIPAFVERIDEVQAKIAGDQLELAIGHPAIITSKMSCRQLYMASL